MLRASSFLFYESADGLGDGLIAHVPAGISSVDELYDALTEALHLPGYFGRNWDALDEVLGDLSWLAPRRVVIVHADLPDLPVEQLTMYLDVLRTAVDEWTRRPGSHELVAAFPEVEQLAIRRLLAGGHGV
jgi:RNAse (barnase) inhibitor barstar